MSITGKSLYNKIQSFRKDHARGTTPEVLASICTEASLQPFLKWFFENVTEQNVLTDEELRIKNKLQTTGDWLEGDALDNVLNEAIKDFPELSEIILLDQMVIDDFQAELEGLKENQLKDEEYEYTLKKRLQSLKEVENKLDEDIEEDSTLLQKMEIEVDLAYKDCFVALERFHYGNQELHRNIQYLLTMYADAAENREAPIILTQVPLDLFVKQIEFYNSYLGMYWKREFSNNDKGEQEADSDYMSLINDSKEKQTNPVEFMLCKTNIANAKKQEILNKIEDSYVGITMLDYVQDIYNNGNPRVPRQSELGTEIEELLAVRDSLEDDVNLLREQQLMDAVQQYAEWETAEVLKFVAELKLERRSSTLEKVKNLQFLAREKGGLHSDLLCLLMEMQFRRVKTVSEFIPCAQQYLSTAYSLSSAREESMQHLAEEYANLLSQSSKGVNSFDKTFISLILGDDTSYETSAALKKYNEVINYNKEHEEKILDELLNVRIKTLLESERESRAHYNDEVKDEPTHSLIATPYVINTRYNEAFNAIQTVQAELTKIRNKLKERMRINNLDREIEILWQRFLADPDTLRTNYEAAKRIAEKTHFGNTYESK